MTDLWPLLKKHDYYLDDRGSITREKKLEAQTPWIYMHYCWNVRCRLWRRILFGRLRFIPSPCHACFKVVARPRTIKELFQLHELGQRLGRRSKCGIEPREFVPGLYGGYFYALGIEEGLARYEEVRTAVSAFISPAVPVILRRGCSVYELELGPSDEWVITPEQRQIEASLRAEIAADILDWDLKPYRQPELLQNFIKKKWIQWAYQNGDPTYLEFTGGKPLHPPAVTYHNSPEAVRKVMPDSLNKC